VEIIFIIKNGIDLTGNYPATWEMIDDGVYELKPCKQEYSRICDI